MQKSQIVQTALELLQDAGLDGLTMRKLAERLQVQNPALYWHFQDKQQLINQMAALLLEGAYQGLDFTDPSAPWMDTLREVTTRLRTMLMQHKDGARLLARADLQHTRHSEVLKDATLFLAQRGFSEGLALAGLITLMDYTLGSAFEEQGEQEPSGAGSSLRRQGFDWGLTLILSGMEQSFQQEQATGTPSFRLDLPLS